MRLSLLTLLLLVSSGCKSKAAAGTDAPATADDPNSDLKAFLAGMLVTSNVVGPSGFTWPEPQESSIVRWNFDNLDTKWGINSFDELQAALNVPPGRAVHNDLWLLGWFNDLPRNVVLARELLRGNPDNLDAAQTLSTNLEALEGPEAALNAVSMVSGRTARAMDKKRAPANPADFEEWRCMAQVRLGKFDDAATSCALATQLDETVGHQAATWMLMLQGKNKEALVEAELAANSPTAIKHPMNALTVGIAQQANGLEKEAQLTFTAGAARFPRARTLARAASGVQLTPQQWLQERSAEEKAHVAKLLASCGLFLSEVRLPERSDDCYQRAEALLKGSTRAHKLWKLSREKPDEALTQLKAAVEAAPSADLMTLISNIYSVKKDGAEALAWANKALELEPWDKKAMSMKWRSCDLIEPKDFVCIIEYRKRMGLPTHFNVKEYEDVSRAWAEQARQKKLSVPQAPTGVKPPPVTDWVLVPVGGRLPEMEGAAEWLGKQFPGHHFSLGSPEPLPIVGEANRLRVEWEYLSEKLREEPGRLYVMEQDLRLRAGGVTFARVDPEHARGVISLSRLRSPVGEDTPPGTVLEGKVLELVKKRFRAQLAGSIARLIGLSWPCEQKGCALRERQTVGDLSEAGFSLCDKHSAEMKALGATKP